MINNLLPSCERMLQAEKAAFEAKYGIRRKSAATRINVLDNGTFLQHNVHILIKLQPKALMATHLKWLSVLFISHLPGIYGRGDSRILLWREKYRIHFNSPICQLILPRRNGKSETQSLYTATCLVSLPGEFWILMSASELCSKNNLELIKVKVVNLLHELNMPFLFKTKTVDSLIFVNYHGLLYLQSEGYGDAVGSGVIDALYLSKPQYFSSCFAISPTDKAARGRKGNVWIDENLFVPDEAITAVAPLITEGDRILAMTCSKNENDESRKLEKIVNKLAENGERTVNFTEMPRKCPACEGLTNITSCDHPKPKPSWLAEDISFVRSFLEIFAPEGVAGAELDNESSGTNEVAGFTKEELLTYDHPKWIYPHDRMPALQWIVVSTDPSGGKKGAKCSKFVTFFLGVTSTHDVIVSFFYLFYFKAKATHLSLTNS